MEDLNVELPQRKENKTKVKDLVIFQDIRPTYEPNENVTLTYSLKYSFTPSLDDWIGIFPVSWTSVNDCVDSVWSSHQYLKETNNIRKVNFQFQFPSNSSYNYAFAYLNNLCEVLGISSPFKIITKDEDKMQVPRPLDTSSLKVNNENVQCRNNWLPMIQKRREKITAIHDVVCPVPSCLKAANTTEILTENIDNTLNAPEESKSENIRKPTEFINLYDLCKENSSVDNLGNCTLNEIKFIKKQNENKVKNDEKNLEDFNEEPVKSKALLKRGNRDVIAYTPKTRSLYYPRELYMQKCFLRNSWNVQMLSKLKKLPSNIICQDDSLDICNNKESKLRICSEKESTKIESELIDSKGKENANFNTETLSRDEFIQLNENLAYYKNLTESNLLEIEKLVKIIKDLQTEVECVKGIKFGFEWRLMKQGNDIGKLKDQLKGSVENHWKQVMGLEKEKALLKRLNYDLQKKVTETLSELDQVKICNTNITKKLQSMLSSKFSYGSCSFDQLNQTIDNFSNMEKKTISDDYSTNIRPYSSDDSFKMNSPNKRNTNDKAFQNILENYGTSNMKIPLQSCDSSKKNQEESDCQKLDIFSTTNKMKMKSLGWDKQTQVENKPLPFCASFPFKNVCKLNSNSLKKFFNSQNKPFRSKTEEKNFILTKSDRLFKTNKSTNTPTSKLDLCSESLDSDTEIELTCKNRDCMQNSGFHSNEMNTTATNTEKHPMDVVNKHQTDASVSSTEKKQSDIEELSYDNNDESLIDMNFPNNTPVNSDFHWWSSEMSSETESIISFNEEKSSDSYSLSEDGTTAKETSVENSPCLLKSGSNSYIESMLEREKKNFASFSSSLNDQFMSTAQRSQTDCNFLAKSQNIRKLSAESQKLSSQSNLQDTSTPEADHPVFYSTVSGNEKEIKWKFADSSWEDNQDQENFPSNFKKGLNVNYQSKNTNTPFSLSPLEAESNEGGIFANLFGSESKLGTSSKGKSTKLQTWSKRKARSDLKCKRNLISKRKGKTTGFESISKPKSLLSSADESKVLAEITNTINEERDKC